MTLHHFLSGLLAVFWMGATGSMAQSIFDPPVREYPSRAIDLQSVDIHARMDAEGKVLRVEVGAVVASRERGIARLAWPIHGLRVDSAWAITVQGDTVAALVAPDSLVFLLDRPLSPTDPFAVSIQYSVTPGEQIGLPVDPTVPGACCLWTRPGWLPLPDDPGDRFSSHLSVSVPAGWSVVAGGRLSRSDGTWQYATPRSSRLQDLGFAAGEFGRQRINGIDYFLPAGSTQTLSTIDGFISQPLRYLTDQTGYRLPWDTLRVAILPLRNALDETSLPGFLGIMGTPDSEQLAELVARQWTHGILAPDWWSEVWALEALAGAFTNSYLRDHLGEATAVQARLNRIEAYLAEANRYRRPLVWDRFWEPRDLRDHHARSKGALILLHIADRIGYPAFWAATRRLLARHAFRTVDTDALINALARGDRGSLSDLFDSWVFGAGHPDLEFGSRFDPGSGRLLLTMEQKQEGALVPTAFPVDSDVEWMLFDGPGGDILSFDDRAGEQEIDLSLPPRFVAFDPKALLAGSIVHLQDLGSTAAQLRFGSTASRIRAASALVEFASDPVASLSLRLALESEETPEVRRAIVRSAGLFPPSPAVHRILEMGLSDADGAVRIQSIRSLAASYPAGGADALFERMAQTDTDHKVQAQAVLAMTGERSESLARAALITPSEGGVIYQAGVDVLARLGSTERALFLEHTASGVSVERILATLPLAANLTTSRPIRIRILELLAHPHVSVRLSAARVATGLLRPGNRPAVNRILAAEWHADAIRALTDLSDQLQN